MYLISSVELLPSLANRVLWCLSANMLPATSKNIASKKGLTWFLIEYLNLGRWNFRIFLVVFRDWPDILLNQTFLITFQYPLKKKNVNSFDISNFLTFLAYYAIIYVLNVRFFNSWISDIFLLIIDVLLRTLKKRLTTRLTSRKL